MEGEVRSVRDSVAAFVAVADAFALPVDDDSYRRWADADPSAATLADVLGAHGSLAAAVAASSTAPVVSVWDRRWGAVVTGLSSSCTQAEIAERTDQPEWRIQRYLATNGLTRCSAGAVAAAEVPLGERRRAEWVAEWGERVEALHADGLTRAEIAERTGQPQWRVIEYLAGAARGRRGPENTERDAAIVAAWVDGATLAEVGDAHGITRERVRQIVEAAGAERRRTPAELRAAATEAEWGPRIADAADRCASVEEICRELPDCSRHFIETYMAANGLRCTGLRERRHRYSDERIVEVLRAAAGSSTLSAGTYSRWAKGRDAPTPQTVMNRFGSWRNALARAGLETASNGARGYVNQWTSQRCIEALRAWLAGGGHGTVAAFDADRAAGADLPSIGTVRRCVGPWTLALRAARLWQDVLDSGAMTVDDADLEPRRWRPEHGQQPDSAAVTAGVATFVTACADDGTHPGIGRYDRWARRTGAATARTVLKVHGRWNVALAAAGYTAVRSSPNPASRTG